VVAIRDMEKAHGALPLLSVGVTVRRAAGGVKPSSTDTGSHHGP
jgi:hypothetical protein